jgi:hypothetical protein
MMVDRIDTAGTGSSGGAVMENSLSSFGVFGRVFAGDGLLPAVNARTTTLLALLTAVLSMTGVSPAVSAEICPNQTVREEQGTTDLGNCRAYELVSPVDKNGGEILVDSARTHAAASDAAGGSNAFAYSSLIGFGELHGMSIAADYVAVRGATGWASHGITPPQEPSSVIFTFFGPGFPDYEGDFSADLSRGVVRAHPSPVLPTTANTQNVENLFLRQDLLEPGIGSYRLATDSSTPLVQLPLSYKPVYAGSSTDFSHILFEGIQPLTPDALGNGNPAVFESIAGQTRLVSILPASDGGGPATFAFAGQGAGGGVSGTERYTPHVISSDGSRISFTVPASDDPSGTQQLYLRDDHGTADTADDTTVRVSASEKTTPDPAQSAAYMDASADGRYVFFTTGEQLTDADTNDTVDLYRYDVQAPAGQHLVLVSADHEDGDATANVEGMMGVSDSGDYAYFMVPGQLVSGAPIPPDPGNPGHEIYLWRDGTLSYIGRLNSVLDTLRDLGNNGWRLALAKTARVSRDGKHLLFSTYDGSALPPGYDQGACDNGLASMCQEFYVYDADTGLVNCATCNPTGAPASENAEVNVRINPSGSATTWHLSHAMSEDGRYVFFSTREALVAQDRNTSIDAYEYDASTQRISLLSSGGADSGDSYFLDASPTGHDVFFATRDHLVGSDIDQGYDAYDARIGGGFPEPAPAAQCSGEGCQGQGSAAPGFQLPASSSYAGPGNLPAAAPGQAGRKLGKAPKRCPRGQLRKKTRGKIRCVKRRSIVTRHGKTANGRAGK